MYLLIGAFLTIINTSERNQTAASELYCFRASCFLITNSYLKHSGVCDEEWAAHTHTHTHTHTHAGCVWLVCVSVGRPCVAFRVGAADLGASSELRMRRTSVVLWQLLAFCLGDHFWHFVDFMESQWADTSATWTRTRTRTCCCCCLSFVWLIFVVWTDRGKKCL